MSSSSEAQRITNLVFYGVVVLVAVLAYKIVQPFLMEIGWAAVLAICLTPLQERLARRLGATRSAAVLTLVVLLVLVVPVFLVAQLLVRQGSEGVGYVQAQIADRGGPMGLVHVAWQWLHVRLPFLPDEREIVEQLSSRLGDVASRMAGHAGAILKGVMSFLFSLTITLGILFFILKDAREMSNAVRRLMPFGLERNAHLLLLIRDIVSASVTSTLLICLLQGLLGGIAFLILGVPGAPLWGALMAVLAVLPALGATLIWAPAAIWLALSGSIVKGVVLALVGVLVLGNVDNVVRPLMLSGTARMSTLTLIISLLGGVSAFGFIGIVLGPVVAAVLTALVQTYAMLPEPEPAAATVATAGVPVPGPPAPASAPAAIGSETDRPPTPLS
jgi:predicted PurR-regulated permease PerM